MVKHKNKLWKIKTRKAYLESSEYNEKKENKENKENNENNEYKENKENRNSKVSLPLNRNIDTGETSQALHFTFIT